MALAAATILEVQTTGNDTNGGGFVTGATGTDWSQQAAAQYSVADAVTAGSTTITSATANFGTDVVGNLLYIVGGTAPITAGWYQITSRTNSTTIVVDRSTGLTAGTGATLNIGGAFLTVAAALAIFTVNNMTIYIKGGTYTISAGLVPSTTPTSAGILNIIGYTTTRGDNGYATIKASAGITLLSLAAGGGGYNFVNIIFDGDSVASTNGCALGFSTNCLINCKIKNMAGYGITATDNAATLSVVLNCEITNCNTTAGINAFYGLSIFYSWIHDNTVPGIVINTIHTCVIGCIISNNTGASSDGIRAITGCFIQNNTIYQNGRHGIFFNSATAYVGRIVSNNIIVNNGGYGWTNSSVPAVARTIYRTLNNFYYNNTSGSLGGTISAGINDVTLTASPFVDAAGNDYKLNNTPGGGDSCKSVGWPGVMLEGTGYQDGGALQSKDVIPVINQVINMYMGEGA